MGSEVLDVLTTGTILFTLTVPKNAKPVNYKIVATLYSDAGAVKESEDIVIFNISDIDI